MSSEQTALQKPVNYGQRFTNEVVKQFGSTIGTLELTPFQQRLAQHLP